MLLLPLSEDDDDEPERNKSFASILSFPPLFPKHRIWTCTRLSIPWSVLPPPCLDLCKTRNMVIEKCTKCTCVCQSCTVQLCVKRNPFVAVAGIDGRFNTLPLHNQLCLSTRCETETAKEIFVRLCCSVVGFSRSSGCRVDLSLSNSPFCSFSLCLFPVVFW